MIRVSIAPAISRGLFVRQSWAIAGISHFSFSWVDVTFSNFADHSSGMLICQQRFCEKE